MRLTAYRAKALNGDSLGNYDRDLYFHRREGNQRYQGLITNAMIRGDWKLIYNSPFAPLELYNLRTDPFEKVNQAAKNPAKFAELAKSLRIQIQRGGAVPWQPPVRTQVSP